MRNFLLACVLGVLGCNTQDPATTLSGLDLAVPPDDMLINGCPSLTGMLGPHLDDGGPDTYASWAQGFFTSYCSRCHSSTLSGNARNGAPLGYDWDSLSIVRMHLSQMRTAVGVQNFMPPSDPLPPCSDRERLVRWIDDGAP
jgi:hypothetical protein